MGQYHMGQYDPDGKEQNPETETDIAKAEFPFIWGISATVMKCVFSELLAAVGASLSFFGKNTGPSGGSTHTWL